MKHFSFIAVVFMLFVFCFGRPVQALEPSNSETLARCSSEELTNLYRKAGRWGDVQLKRRIAEEIGERGARDFAQKQGWDPLLTKADKSAGHPQGFDQVWRSSDGKIHVVEAKGGESYLSTGRFGTQGTTEWCVKAAEKTLKNHAATEAEKSVARTVIEAASKGELDIYVLQTPHIQGAAGTTVCKGMEECTQEATRQATKLLSRNTVHSFESSAEVLSRNMSNTAEAAESARYSGSWNSPAYEYKRPVYEYERPAPRPGYSVETSPNLYGRSMRAASQSNESGVVRVAEAADKGVSKAARSATKSLSKVSVATKAIAGAGVAVDAGLRARDAYETEQRYHNGEIDNHERVVSHVKNGTGMAGGWGGAAVCGYGGAKVGALVGSIVPGPGNVIGGAIGGVGGAIGGYFFFEKAAEAGVDCADDYFYGR